MIRAVSACFPVASLPPLSFCLFQSADCDRKRVVSLASRAHKRLASTHPAPIFSDPHSSTPAAQPIMDMLYSVCFKNRERVEEERWTRGRPIGSTRYTPLSERIPVQRVVEDYRRTDYRYNDHVPTRHPSSTQTYHDHSAQDTRSSYRNSRIDSKGVTVVSRPGSPGPVAGAGDVINTPHGFTIQLDVKLFRPEQIKIVLTEDLLCVSGERIEVGAGGQTLKRSFARKYCIPPDIHLDSVRSHLDHNGVLIINGSRRGWRETHINIHPHGYGDRRSNSLISTV